MGIFLYDFSKHRMYMKRNKRGDERIVTSTITIHGEVFAAIAAALYEVTENVHDNESNILTINRAATPYSPWRSKVHGLREPLKR